MQNSLLNTCLCWIRLFEFNEKKYFFRCAESQGIDSHLQKKLIIFALCFVFAYLMLLKNYKPVASVSHTQCSKYGRV